MFTKKMFFLAACLCVVALNYSCTEESTSETDDTYSLNEAEVKNQDT